MKDEMEHPEDSLSLAMYEHLDNMAIGRIGLIPPMQSHTKAAEDEIEIGYWIGKLIWGNGYIPEAIKRLQEYVFNDLRNSAMC